MSLGVRGRVFGAICVLFGGFLAALSAHTLSFAVRTEGSDVVVESGGHVFRGELGGTAPLEVRYYPQERHSTEQVFVEDRGFLRNGLAILSRLGRRRPKEPPVVRQEAGVTRRYVLFDPFRGAVTVHRGTPELRIEVNVPDDAMESWQAGKKTHQVKMQPPRLRLTFAPLAAAVLLAGLLVLGALLLGGGRTGETPAPAAPPGGWRAPALVFLFGTALSAAVLHGALGAMPGFGDEMNYLMEGRILAAGRLSVPEPPNPEFFRVGWMDMFGADHKVWGFHPPGQSALLALGWLLGVPWATVPIVFGGMLAVAYLLARDVLGSHGWALANVAVVATSHYVLSLSNSYMAHAPSWLFLGLYLLFLLRFARTGKGSLLLLAAACAGAAFCVRPMSAVLASLVPLPAALACARGKAKARTWALALAIGLAVSSLVFLYTWGITGRFTLPYAIKGPEVGQTVWVRLTRGWAVHEANLFRNVNELQHRVHSFGLLGNSVFLFVPLVLAAARKKRLGGALALAYATFATFVLVHSVLHWYGWKWEPRMLFDVAFLFFLATTAGLRGFAELLPAGAARKAAGAVAGLAVLYVAAVDLPRRLGNEYRDYNQAPTGVREAIRRQGIRNAVVFFGGEKAYACYTPYNAITFDGDVVYARVQGELLDYQLLARFPGKEAWFTPDGNTLVRRPNFYRKDLAALKADLAALGAVTTTVVLPWRDVAPTPLNDALAPATVEEPGRFLARLAGGGPGAPRTAVFVEGAAELARLVDLSFETATPAVASAYEGPIAFRTIGPRRPGTAGTFPGIRMTCREGTKWDGKILSEQIVSTLDIGVCPGENRSMTFETSFALKTGRRFVFATESDDGSGVFVDGALVVDNDLEGTHGPELKSGAVVLGPGVHTLLVKYFNGPGGARLLATLEDRAGKAVPISVAGFVDEFHFFVPGRAPEPPADARGR